MACPSLAIFVAYLALVSTSTAFKTLRVYLSYLRSAVALANLALLSLYDWVAWFNYDWAFPKSVVNVLILFFKYDYD